MLILGWLSCVPNVRFLSIYWTCISKWTLMNVFRRVSSLSNVRIRLLLLSSILIRQWTSMIVFCWLSCLSYVWLLCRYRTSIRKRTLMLIRKRCLYRCWMPVNCRYLTLSCISRRLLSIPNVWFLSSCNVRIRLLCICDRRCSI